MFVMEQEEKLPKKKILTSQRHVKYLLAGQNTQHINVQKSVIIIRNE